MRFFLFAFLLGWMPLVYAEEAKKSAPAFTFSGSLSLVTDYVSRGISQSARKPAIEGEMKITHKSGLYFKTDAYSVDGTGNFLHNTSLELDLYLGLKKETWIKKLFVDFGLLYYYYPGGEAPVPARPKYDTLEYYVGFSKNDWEIKLSVTLTDFFADNSSDPPFNWNKKRFSRPNGSSYGSIYLELNKEWKLPKKWKIAAHVGYQTVTNYSMLNYLDWQITVTYSFDWVDAWLSYTETNANPAFYNIPDSAYHPTRLKLGGAEIIFGVTKNF